MLDANRYLHKMAQKKWFTQGCAFCSKNRYFSYPWLSRLRKCLLDFAFNIKHPESEHPYYSSEFNKSDIANRQIGGEKL